MPALADAPSADVSTAAFVNQVRNATERLPLDQAHALWLVDECGCSYDQVAHETNTYRTTIAERVANGRHFIRAMLVTESAGTSVG
ncbi:MAG: DNA-directed RNA polymerase specialized sigma24 family protein [Acidimicrobiales bacterium]|jgi:DNA-directed RNA polymerase specialized sigma24 family protein